MCSENVAKSTSPPIATMSVHERKLGSLNLKLTTHAPETGARNWHHKFHARFWSVCHTVWRQIFTSASFWSQIETALFLRQKPAGTAFSDWLTDLFTFSASTVWDF